MEDFPSEITEVIAGGILESIIARNIEEIPRIYTERKVGVDEFLERSKEKSESENLKKLVLIS